MDMIRMSIPGYACTHCGSTITELVTCPGCGWVDPLTKRPESVLYVENPDGTIRDVSPVEREAIESAFNRFKEAPASVSLSFSNGNVVTYRKRKQ